MLRRVYSPTSLWTDMIFHRRNPNKTPFRLYKRVLHSLFVSHPFFTSSPTYTSYLHLPFDVKVDSF